MSMTSTYQLLQVARDASLEGRSGDRGAVLDEIGVDSEYVRCIWATTLVRDEPSMRRIHAETYLIVVRAAWESFAMMDIADRRRLLVAQYFRIRNQETLDSSPAVREYVNMRYDRIRSCIEALDRAEREVLA